MSLLLFTAGLVVVSAGPCGDWSTAGGVCTAGEARDAEDGHSCGPDNKCDEGQCCGISCGEGFTGTCGAGETVHSGHRMYGSSTGKGWSFDGVIDWTLVGTGAADGCCTKTCKSAAAVTCAADKVLADRKCVWYSGSAESDENPTGKVDVCDQADETKIGDEDFDGCCETETCMHTSCNLLTPDDFDEACKAHGANKCETECDIEEDSDKAYFDGCAACVNVAGADEKCIPCIQCYGSLYFNGMKVTDPRPASGSGSSGSSGSSPVSVLFVALVALFD